jgi:hypothetical protein
MIDRILVDARDVREGDMIAQVGRVLDVHVSAGEVVLNVSFSSSSAYVLAPDHLVWIDREQLAA